MAQRFTGSGTRRPIVSVQVPVDDLGLLLAASEWALSNGFHKGQKGINEERATVASVRKKHNTYVSLQNGARA